MSIFNILLNIAIYVSIPIVIRYVILRRPLRRRWVALSILVPLFIVFATVIGNQREEGQRRIARELGIPYRSTPHMIGSPLLYGAMIASYFILLGGRKKIEAEEGQQSSAADETTSSQSICPVCNAEVSSEARFCHKCGTKIEDGKEI